MQDTIYIGRKMKSPYFWEDGIIRVPKFGSMEYWILKMAPHHPDTLYVVWVEEITRDVCRLVNAYNRNTLLIAKKYDFNHWTSLTFPVSNERIYVGDGPEKAEHRCFTFGKAIISNLRNINVFGSYSKMDAHIRDIAQERGMHITHIVDSGWLVQLFNELQYPIICPARRK